MYSRAPGPLYARDGSLLIPPGYGGSAFPTDAGNASPEEPPRPAVLPSEPPPQPDFRDLPQVATPASGNDSGNDSGNAGSGDRGRSPVSGGLPSAPGPRAPAPPLFASPGKPCVLPLPGVRTAPVTAPRA